MADENEVPPSATGQMPRVRRRAPTIDLKATEIAVDQPPSADPVVSPEPQSASAPDEPATPAYETEAAAEPASEFPPTEPPQQPPAPPPSASGSFRGWPIVAAALSGGLAALIVVGLLWAGGMFAAPAENPSDQRIARMEARLQDMANRPVPPQVEMRIIEELSGRVARLEKTPPPPGNGLLGAVEDAVRPVQTAVSDLTRRIDDNAAAVREARGQADAALIAAEAARVAAEKTDLTALGNRVAALESASKSLADNVAKSLASADDKPLRAVVVAQALQAAVERGGAFVPELAAAKAVAPNTQALALLEQFAATGLPSPAVLSRELSQIVPAILKSVSTPQQTGGFLERLQANAEKLVRVRPIDEAPGDDPAAIVSRAEAKAARGDLAGAVTELNFLPPDLRAPADDWIRKVEARTAAMNASRRVVADALAAFGKSP